MRNRLDEERRAAEGDEEGYSGMTDELEDDAVMTFPCERCGHRTQVAPPSGTRIVPSVDGARGHPFSFQCEAEGCGATNKVVAPKGYRLELTERGRRTETQEVLRQFDHTYGESDVTLAAERASRVPARSPARLFDAIHRGG